MPAKSTFHQQARRDQLVALTTEIIGAEGLAAASISAVARAAGTSRGVVTYNVGDRVDLLSLVVARAYALGVEEVRGEVDAAADQAAALRAFVTGSLDFYARHPAQMRALREIFADPGLVERVNTPGHQHEVDDLTELLRAGTRAGLFVDVEPRLAVPVIRAALDHAAAAIADGADDDRLRSQVVALVERIVGVSAEQGAHDA